MTRPHYQQIADALYERDHAGGAWKHPARPPEEPWLARYGRYYIFAAVVMITLAVASAAWPALMEALT